MACDPIKLPGGGTAIICGGRSRSTPCHYCQRRSSRLCDHPIIRKGKRTTCDAPLCADCTNIAQENVDLCRPHFNLYRNNGNKFKLGDVEISQ